MKTTLRRTVAATAAGAVAAATTLALGTSPATSAQAPDPVKTTFAFGGYAFGSQVVANGIDVRGALLGFSDLKCTQWAGRPAETGSVLPEQLEAAVPEQIRSIVDAVGVLKTSNRSFTADGGRTHVSESTSSLAGIEIGGKTLPGLEGVLPTIKLTGLTSTATAKHIGGEFVPSHDFTFGGLDIEIPEDSPIPAELGQLLEVIEEATDGVTQNVDPIIEELIKLTDGVSELIEIPGLGSIDMGTGRTTKTTTGATSEASTLVLTIDPDGAEGTRFAPTRLTLGRAFARIGKTVHEGVFRSHAVPLELNVLGLDLLTFRSDSVQSIACEGTGGRTVKRTFPPIPSLLTEDFGPIHLTDATTEFSGEQFKRGRIVKGRRTNLPWTRGTMSTTVGNLSIPLAGVEIKDLVTGLAVNTKRLVKQRDGGRTYVRNIVRSVGSLVLGGQTFDALPKVGEAIPFAFQGGDGILEGLGLGSGRIGRTMVPLKLTLIPTNGGGVVEMLIGEASMHLARKN